MNPFLTISRFTQSDEQHNVHVPRGCRRMQHRRRRPTAGKAGYARQEVEVTPVRIGCRSAAVRLFPL